MGARAICSSGSMVPLLLARALGWRSCSRTWSLESSPGFGPPSPRALRMELPSPASSWRSSSEWRGRVLGGCRTPTASFLTPWASNTFSRRSRRSCYSAPRPRVASGGMLRRGATCATWPWLWRSSQCRCPCSSSSSCAASPRCTVSSTPELVRRASGSGILRRPRRPRRQPLSGRGWRRLSNVPDVSVPNRSSDRTQA